MKRVVLKILCAVFTFAFIALTASAQTVEFNHKTGSNLQNFYAPISFLFV